MHKTVINNTYTVFYAPYTTTNQEENRKPTRPPSSQADLNSPKQYLPTKFCATREQHFPTKCWRQNLAPLTTAENTHQTKIVLQICRDSKHVPGGEVGRVEPRCSPARGFDLWRGWPRAQVRTSGGRILSQSRLLHSLLS